MKLAQIPHSERNKKVMRGEIKRTVQVGLVTAYDIVLILLARATVLELAGRLHGVKNIAGVLLGFFRSVRVVDISLGRTDS